MGTDRCGDGLQCQDGPQIRNRVELQKALRRISLIGGDRLLRNGLGSDLAGYRVVSREID